MPKDKTDDKLQILSNYFPPRGDGPRKELSGEMKGFIAGMYFSPPENYSYRSLSQTINVPVSTIRNITNKFKTEMTVKIAS